MDLLKTYDWPGSVREIDNLQQLIVLASQSTINGECGCEFSRLPRRSSPNGTVLLLADELSVGENETMAAG